MASAQIEATPDVLALEWDINLQCCTSCGEIVQCQAILKRLLLQIMDSRW